MANAPQHTFTSKKSKTCTIEEGYCAAQCPAIQNGFNTSYCATTKKVLGNTPLKSYCASCEYLLRNTKRGIAAARFLFAVFLYHKSTCKSATDNVQQ